MACSTTTPSCFFKAVQAILHRQAIRNKLTFSMYSLQQRTCQHPILFLASETRILGSKTGLLQLARYCNLFFDCQNCRAGQALSRSGAAQDPKSVSRGTKVRGTNRPEHLYLLFSQTFRLSEVRLVFDCDGMKKYEGKLRVDS
jgi:hypothetical protein